MPDRETLRSIKTFPSLVKYLRDEMDWPIDAEDFEDLTFDYEPDELGIDAKTAAKIEQIKQLRPLTTNQPWGIFFIKFEPKQLPVLALRRILSSLVIKKRASARSSEQAAWALNDLLFISNFGEGEERQITFAHFSEDVHGGGLPTLKVLGWDDADTALHIDHVHHELITKLHWPENIGNLDAWRSQWSSAFTLRHMEVIRTSKDLAVRLAALARRIRLRADRVLAIETERGALRKLHKAFKDALIHDLSEHDFADMYAQTVTYGLFSAAVSRPAGVIADNLADMVPITNPFLKEMLGMFLTVGGHKGRIDFDELGIKDVVELLNSPDTHMDAVLRDIGDKTRQEDPVIYFYEFFLTEYDKKKKVQRGVFYTPQPVVSYIVRSVHELLQTEFGLEDGLASTVTWGEMVERNANFKLPSLTDEIDEKRTIEADEPFVQILDPATGTGTFLVEVIGLIEETVKAKECSARLKRVYCHDRDRNHPELVKAWNEYVPKHLLPRLYGYELMMAPYAIAHMKIGLKLQETGYRFHSDERVRVYLTNALEPKRKQLPQTGFDALSHEASCVNQVKWYKRFTVVIGNPPYSGQSANVGQWIEQLLRSRLADGAPSFFEVDGSRLDEPNTKWLNDDYVKFLRLAQALIANSGTGLAGLITNHSWLENPTFRGMRQSIVYTFPRAFVLDLHGNAKKKEKAPDGSKDENVFDIQQGVGISILVTRSTGVTIGHSDLFGLRPKKYSELQTGSIQSTQWTKILPQAPLYLWRHFDLSNFDEYLNYIVVTDIFGSGDIAGRGSSWAKGLATTKDHLFVSFDRQEAFHKISILAASSTEISDLQAAETLDLEDTPYFRIADARKEIRHVDWKTRICAVNYRPFDNRVLYWHPELYDIGRGASSKRVMSHMFKPNLALITSRMTKGEQFAHVFASRYPVEVIFLSSKTSNNAFVFPFRFYRDFNSQLGLGFKEESSSLNLSNQFLAKLAITLGLSLSISNLPENLTAEDIFYYVYSIFHSPSYRDRYAEFLKIDFPRLPLTSNLELFRELAKRGGELVPLHLMEKHAPLITTFQGKGDNTVEKVRYTEPGQGSPQGRVWINSTQYFEGVPPEVWEFHIGGYQVCEKWLKDRGPKKGQPGRKLSEEDILHYQRVVAALKETIRIMGEIDAVIEAHGGWPLPGSVESSGGMINEMV